jgi:hypothetical protein
MYRGRNNKPIGKPVSEIRNAPLPAFAKRKDFAFGIQGAQKADESFAKDLIYPENHEDTTEKDKIYIKSHKKFPPGDQKVRNYEWGGIQPRTHRFGRVDAGSDKTAAACFKASADDPYAPDTYIVSRKTFDYQQTQEQLGKPRPLGQSSPAGITFGVQSSVAKLGKDAWGASECIRGSYSMAEQMPDPDLGRATKRGTRNISLDGRTFGCPSLRTDRPVPKRRSVADNNNYGTDATAQDLIAPARFSSAGVVDQDFFDQRHPDEIREIFERIGYPFSDEEFRCIWWRAATGMDWNEDGIVSIQEFRAAMNEFLDCKKRGAKPKWWADALGGSRAQLASDTADAERAAALRG